MDYEKMKALMEANRDELPTQRNTDVKEFPMPDSMKDWDDLDYLPKERIAA